jgi:phosphoenolpyruvate-protein kinase (PTS system EI component)
MPERLLPGAPASPGVAHGTAWRPSEEVHQEGLVAPERRAQQLDSALTALAAAAEALTELAAELSLEEAEIVATGALMAQDPLLVRAVEQAVIEDGLTAAEAIIRATGEHAEAISALGDQTLAARADDVRSLGRRAARMARGEAVGAPPGSSVILIAHDLGPADVAELAPALAGVALAGGGATAHAAIVARSLGIPMVTGLFEQVPAIADGTPLVLDGASGALILEPSPERLRAAKADMEARQLATQWAHELRDRPAVTTDGITIAVLANVASREELDVGLRAGAEGIGLLRTELAFLGAADWPTEQEHTNALAPILSGLRGASAVVRVLDFGADKSPPFLQDVPQRGLELLLAHPEAFTSQLRAILLLSRRHELRILLPLVDTAEQLAESRDVIQHVALSLGIADIPPLGAMIETPTAAQNAHGIAQGSDFLSIGTNDLTATTLRADRFAGNTARAHHPRVLRAIARSVAAAHDAGIRIEVCGESASDPIMLPLLVGLGIDELSVGAARVGEVRDWIRRLGAAEAAGLARSAVTMDTADEVEWTLRPVATELQASRTPDPARPVPALGA